MASKSSRRYKLPGDTPAPAAFALDPILAALDAETAAASVIPQTAVKAAVPGNDNAPAPFKFSLIPDSTFGFGPQFPNPHIAAYPPTLTTATMNPDGRAEDLYKKLTERDQKIEALEWSLHDARKDVSRLETSNKDLEHARKDLEKQLEDSKDEATYWENSVTKANNELEEYEARFIQDQQGFEGYKQTCQRKDAEIQMLRNKRDDLEAMQVALHQQVDEYTADYKDVEKQFKDLYAISKPYEEMAEAVRDIFSDVGDDLELNTYLDYIRRNYAAAIAEAKHKHGPVDQANITAPPHHPTSTDSSGPRLSIANELDGLDTDSMEGSDHYDDAAVEEDLKSENAPGAEGLSGLPKPQNIRETTPYQTTARPITLSDKAVQTEPLEVPKPQIIREVVRTPFRMARRPMSDSSTQTRPLEATKPQIITKVIRGPYEIVEKPMPYIPGPYWFTMFCLFVFLCFMYREVWVEKRIWLGANNDLRQAAVLWWRGHGHVGHSWLEGIRYDFERLISFENIQLG